MSERLGRDTSVSPQVFHLKAFSSMYPTPMSRGSVLVNAVPLLATSRSVSLPFQVMRQLITKKGYSSERRSRSVAYLTFSATI